ncbi:hypothetical protein ATO12_24740 [Aquimarina atlantica]|uniref:DoxX family protein n=1 Tax=Aquimarina atlantica TaxID=1317122 RepID=A0A023BQE6_9FLAO|nr:hypothetical protein [Aquimarina atlantica]EZH72144.1 hypothetical protein ATO12_24740 [Aquimarina atlantica]
MITNNKILLRFLLLFFGLLTFPFPINIIPKLDVVQDPIVDLYHIIIPWIGKNILQLDYEITVFTNGSGDTTYDYVLVLFFIVVAAIGTVIWSFFDKKERDYEQLNYWFLVFLRYYVGYVMLSYGIVKVIPLQFREPSFYRLLLPYGESSPMGLVWTFMGASKGYTIISGLAEMIGGLLLFHRKTVILGGMILIPVLTNIVLINFCYDVPVKLYSSELLIMLLLIMAPHLKRLLNVILLNAPTIPIQYKEPFTIKRRLQIKNAVKWIAVVFFLYSTIADAIESSKKYGPSAPKPPLYGLYEVTDFKVNSREIPPILTDTIRWRFVSIEWLKSIRLYRTDMSGKNYKSKIDTIRKKIELAHRKDSTKVYTLNYSRTDSTMHIQGVFMKDTIDCKTKRLDKKDFLLTGRGFNWINEYPYNR